MTISRRALLASAVAAPALTRSSRRCMVVESDCLLPESIAGFQTQIVSTHHADPDLVIVPGAASLPPALVQPFLDCGATVLVELFASDGHITPEPYFPYIEYSWPIKVKIREFAAVSLRPARGDRVIATYAGHPVALRRRAGRGTLLLLGSPLGPVFLSGDQDARRWLNAILLTSSARS